jgi:uncharacterized integral membrane protein (TIGR00697 family)
MNSEKINFKIILVLVLYLSSLLAANTLGLKLMPFIFGTHLSVAVFFFPFVFLSTDVIGQVYGKAWAKNFVYAGLLATALFTLYAALSLSLPWSTTNEKMPEAYALIFGVSLRMSLASLLAFFIAEYQDVLAFFFFKKLLRGRFFWLQSNLSNLWSQLLDTLIFMFVAFAGIYPVKTIILASLPWWLYKVAMGLAYTPLSYLGVYLLRYGNTRPQD